MRRVSSSLVVLVIPAFALLGHLAGQQRGQLPPWRLPHMVKPPMGQLGAPYSCFVGARQSCSLHPTICLVSLDRCPLGAIALPVARGVRARARGRGAVDRIALGGYRDGGGEVESPCPRGRGAR